MYCIQNQNQRPYAGFVSGAGPLPAQWTSQHIGLIALADIAGRSTDRDREPDSLDSKLDCLPPAAATSARPPAHYPERRPAAFLPSFALSPLNIIRQDPHTTGAPLSSLLSVWSLPLFPGLQLALARRFARRCCSCIRATGPPPRARPPKAHRNTASASSPLSSGSRVSHGRQFING